MLHDLLRRLHPLKWTCTLLLLPAGVALAQASQGTTLVLQPHCSQEELNDDWILGEVPEIPSMIALGEGRCPDFEVETPQMLKTRLMDQGDTLDLDVVIKNPEQKAVHRARVWLSYDPNILQGVSVDIDSDFPEVAPGEEDFDAEQGYVMIDATAQEGEEPAHLRVTVARVKFTVRETTPGGTIIGFHDVQQDGHTFVLKKDASDPDGVPLLTGDPGSLHVIFGRRSGETCQSDSDCLAGTCIQGACTQSGELPDGAPCSINSQCESGECREGVCASGNRIPSPAPEGDDADDIELQPNGSICTDSSECLSQFCFEGFCRADGDVPDGGACGVDQECISGTCREGVCGAPVPPGEEEETRETTAFSLLQVQNLGVTTQEDNAYLGWDALESSRLKAYNMYYGTTTGRYIQRKTVEGSMTSLVLHSLPVGTTYYFALRAVSTDDEESAFSNEVSVTIGDPTSSTAPFTADLSGLVTAPPNPVGANGEFPGETGSSSTIAFLVFASAVIGTLFAFRRQGIASVTEPSL